MALADRLLQMVRAMERAILDSPEVTRPTTRPPSTATQARVDYYAITPKGSKSRFSGRMIALNQMPGNPRSETAIRAYLQRQHPGTEIQLNSVDFE